MAATQNQSGGAPSENLTLHEMFRIIGDQMTPVDLEKLGLHISNGYEFFLTLEKMGRVDVSNFKIIYQILTRILDRYDLLQYVTLRRYKPVEVDPVVKYLEETAQSCIIYPSSSQTGTRRLRCDDKCTSSTPSSSSSSLLRNSPSSSSSSPSFIDQPSHPPSCVRNQTELNAAAAAHLTTQDQLCSNTLSVSTSDETSRKRKLAASSSARAARHKRRRPTLGEDVEEEVAAVMAGDVKKEEEEIKKKVTCDIRLRVRAEYCEHHSALDGHIFSNKPQLIERQFERFMQANTILKSRDLGSIICDIKFSELTYLDAFWRDYINGSLLEALKGVFITESLKHAVGHEAIKLLINVDEDDYEAGRRILLQNLTE